MEHVSDNYIVSFHAERVHRNVRFYWTISAAHNPDQLVAWGHAPTKDLAETAARNEVRDLSSGLSQGGRVTTPGKSLLQHR